MDRQKCFFQTLFNAEHTVRDLFSDYGTDLW